MFDQKEYMKIYRKENEEKLLQYGKNYRQKNKNKAKEQKKCWYQKNRKTIRDQHRTYYQKNKEQILIRNKNNTEKYICQWKHIIKERYGKIKCQICGYDRNFASLDFHHKNPKEKETRISKLIRQKPTPKRVKELDKCDLVCKNCHGEIHHPKNGLH